MATIKGIYELIKKDQLEGKEINSFEQAIVDAVEAEQFTTTKEVNLTFIKNKDGGEDGNY
ncbi:hypothetical protein [Candidatus Pelagibacter sp. HIMB1509]|uniref:hypothetical protein n=1 Tax=Candidatus Pelagibacter sp. HIMB1509 TaxID=3413339 RepID=UPI003F87A8CF